MIVREKLTINKVNFIRHYSDSGFMIRKVGTDEKYVEAIDLTTNEFKYEETNEPIPKSDEES